MPVLLLIVSLFLSKPVFSYSCSEDCNDSCKVSAMGASGVNPVCFAACKSWMAGNCWDLSKPLVSASGEMGATAYPSAASIMSTRNPIWGALDEQEKKILRPFYGNIVDKVKLHLKAGMMDRWGDPPLEVDLGSSNGQTYGYDVYIAFYRTELDRAERVALIGHELCHTRQYVQRGESLQKFGRDYFEYLVQDGGYEANRMEEECYAIEEKILTAAQTYFLWYDQHKRPWSFQVCNKSGFETISIALGWPHKSDGFTLVPAPLVKGWYNVKKGECKSLLTNLKSDEAIDAYASAGAAGNWTWWGGHGGAEYCIDPVNKFENGYRTHCGKRNLQSVSFKEIDNPWRTQGNGTYTWNLSGEPTLIKICNRSGKRIWGALSKNEHGKWMARGWFEYTPNQCRDWNLGVYKGSVYVYGENDGASTTWQDSTQLPICAFNGTAFATRHNGTCGKGGKLVKPYEFKVTTGSQTWNYNP